MIIHLQAKEQKVEAALTALSNFDDDGARPVLYSQVHVCSFFLISDDFQLRQRH